MAKTEAGGEHGEPRKHWSFNDLVHEEERRLEPQAKGKPLTSDGVVEPRVVFTNKDRLGLALSGGGIRSASFNLGLLQALARRYGKQSLLEKVDYLSTVSGGGYIGGFWKRWLSLGAEVQGKARAIFPQGKASCTESPAVRHLRERSRFLVPRVGFTRSETWDAVIAVLGGMLPALAMAAATLAVVVYGWVAVLYVCFRGDLALLSVGGFGVLVFAVHMIPELWWHARVRPTRTDLWWYGFIATLHAALGGVAWNWVLDSREETSWMPRADESLGLLPLSHLDRTLLYPAAIWAALGVATLCYRGLSSRRDGVQAFRRVERSAARCFAPALVWGLLVIIWATATQLRECPENYVGPGTAAAVTTTSALLFAWLRDWLATPVVETQGSRLLDRAATVLKPMLPRLMASATLLGMLICTTMLVQVALEAPLWIGLGVVLGVAVTSLTLFDPTRVGLHDFYRRRIAASFLQAARVFRADTSTEESDDDDVTLGDLETDAPARPIHLVCCTANNLSGDALPNLYRGGRSVAVSSVAVSLGNYAAPMPELRLSSVLTASAAAFNSQMGSFSMRFGGAVAFVMCALNLRLGLWIPHPAAARSRRWFPGVSFFLEMLSRSRTDFGRRPGPRSQIHLSDGGHFENLGLYELVRRHCRYIIVSDCGADQHHQFNDLANAVRRIREDFGVEIELDTQPIKAGPDGLSQQHVVVGSIHYDGPSGSDKGTILYFKPTLVGEEPTDIHEYRAMNPAFPHESTGDQFYDEAQWESYRRLGEYSASVAFRFLQDNGMPDNGDFVDRVFLDAIERWQRPNTIDVERLRELAVRRDNLLDQLRDNAPPHLRAELVPVLASALGASNASASSEQQIQAMFYCVRIAALMEEVWDAASLDSHWSHPTNQGWMSFFHACASMPSFRANWPLLRPFFGAAFRDFVKIRFGLRLAVAARPYEDRRSAVAFAYATAVPLKNLRGPAIEDWKQRYGEPDSMLDALDYCMTLAGEEVSVGFLLYRREANCVAWLSNHFYVPPALFGAGVTARFLDAVIAHFREDNLKVTLTEGVGPSSDKLTDSATRNSRVRTLSFYKSRGFRQCDEKCPAVLELFRSESTSQTRT